MHAGFASLPKARLGGAAVLHVISLAHFAITYARGSLRQ